MNHYLTEHQKRFEIGDLSKQIEDSQYIVIERLLQSIVRPNLLAVEIGSWTGTSAVVIGTVIKRVLGKLYSIDWYQGSVFEGYHLKLINELYHARNIFLDNIQFFDLSETVIQIPKTSLEASKDFEDESIDFIFIDGDHSYKEVTNDINYWYPKLKKNGIIAGHDFNNDHPEVKLAVMHRFLDYTEEKGIWYQSKI